jgi:hypothetical protein
LTPTPTLPYEPDDSSKPIVIHVIESGSCPLSGMYQARDAQVDRKIPTRRQLGGGTTRFDDRPAHFHAQRRHIQAEVLAERPPDGNLAEGFCEDAWRREFAKLHGGGRIA